MNGIKRTHILQEADRRDALLKELRDLWHKKAVVKIRSDQIQQGFYSTFFHTTKKSQNIGRIHASTPSR